MKFVTLTGFMWIVIVMAFIQGPEIAHLFLNFLIVLNSFSLVMIGVLLVK